MKHFGWTRLLSALCFLLFTVLLCANEVVSNELISISASPRHSTYAVSIAEHLSQRIGDLHRQIGIYPKAVAEFEIVHDAEAYALLSKGRKIIEHSDAFYSAIERKIYIRGPEQINDNYLKILLHEYIHWYVDYIFGKAPLWFHEGMAVEYSGQFGLERYYHFARYSFWGERMSLSNMYFDYPQRRQDWDLFYLTSAFVIKYMRESEPQKWQAFWDYAARYHRSSFSAAFYYAYRLPANAFTKEFEAYTRRIGWQYLFIGFNGIVLSLLPLILTIAYFVRRHKMQQLPDLVITEEEPENCPEEKETL